MLCTKIDLNCQKQFLYTTCSPQVWAWNFHLLNLCFNEQSVVILWVSWCKNKSFWQRFTCNKAIYKIKIENTVETVRGYSKNYTPKSNDNYYKLPVTGDFLTRGWGQEKIGKFKFFPIWLDDLFVQRLGYFDHLEVDSSFGRGRTISPCKVCSRFPGQH